MNLLLTVSLEVLVKDRRTEWALWMALKSKTSAIIWNKEVMLKFVLYKKIWANIFTQIDCVCCKAELSKLTLASSVFFNFKACKNENNPRSQ